MKHDAKKFVKRKESSSKYTLLAIIAIILILGLAALIFVKPLLIKEKYGVYNHFEFEEVNGYWQTHIQYNNMVTPITFNTHPVDLQNIPFDDNLTTYILYEPISSFVIAIREDAGSVPVIAGVNIARILGDKFYGFDVSSALYVDEDMKNQTNTTIPIINCVDATKTHPIIFIDVNATEKSIEFSKENNYCIHISSPSAQKEDILGMADLFVYKILEIM
jgi:hypothetical protein